jgi:hypothetical protein
MAPGAQPVGEQPRRLLMPGRRRGEYRGLQRAQLGRPALAFRDRGQPPRWHPALFDLCRTALDAISTMP